MNTELTPTATTRIQPQTPAEKIVWYAFIGTYGFYLTGTLYVAGSVVGWLLFGCLVWEWWKSPESIRSRLLSIPMTLWLWVVGMIMMQVALVIGHLDFNLPFAVILKSSVGWAKGWALLAILPLSGMLKIRPQIFYRAACIVCLHSLLLFPVFYAAYVLRLPMRPIVFPLNGVGPGPEFFSINLYDIDPSNHQPRWQFFAPWAPAMGFMANVYFFMALREANRWWRWIGLFGSIFICVVTVSRLALVAILGVSLLTYGCSRLHRPLMLFGMAIASSVGSLLSIPILQTLETTMDRFNSARADSSRVRAALGRIALHRWETEAPIWGHGIVEDGPHLVEFMPIGSHHTWFGLLFVKGIVGFFSLAIPMAVSFLVLVAKAQESLVARTGLSMILILFLYTFGENLEMLAYLYWPALVFMGVALAEPVQLFQPRQPVEDLVL